MPQPIRIQVWPHPLLVCLSYRLLPGPQSLSKTTPSSRQPTSVIHRDTSRNGLSQCCMHVHQPVSQVCKLGESLALRKVKTPHNDKTSVSRFPLTKQEILSQYSGCFEGIGHFPGDPYKFHLKPDHKPAKTCTKESSSPS